jgi:FKBP-type peptidyl-prolyl cis-trans isomerase (trigger factor)
LPGSIIDKDIQGLVETFTDSQVRKGASAKSFKGHIDEIGESLFRAAEIRASAGIVLDKIAEAEETKINNESSRLRSCKM